MMQAVLLRYIVGAIVGILASVGIVEQSTVEAVTATLLALATGAIEYFANRGRS